MKKTSFFLYLFLLAMALLFFVLGFMYGCWHAWATAGFNTGMLCNFILFEVIGRKQAAKAAARIDKMISDRAAMHDINTDENLEL